jgi:FeS assembly protein IscX
MRWTDITDIAIELTEARPDVDPLSVNFVDLRAWVLALPGFEDDPDHCGEKILEAIQAAWIEELD